MKKLAVLTLVVLSFSNVFALSESSERKCEGLVDMNLNSSHEVVVPAESSKERRPKRKSVQDKG